MRSKMTSLKFWIPTLVVIFLLGYFSSKVFKLQKRSGLPISPNILYFTSPTTSFVGRVEKVEGNIVTVSQELTIIEPTPVLNPNQPPPPIPTPIRQIITYKIEVTKDTTISRPPLMINYLFVTPTPIQPPRFSIPDIQNGQTITILTNSDLRILQGNKVVAESIQLPAISNAQNGTITKVEGNIITLQAYSPTSPNPVGNIAPLQRRQYFITVTKDTEVSQISKSSTPEKFSLSDLMPGMQINVYTDQDITTTDHLTALRIEPLLSNPLPLLGTSSSPQSTPSATSSVPTVPTATTQLSTSR
ncbi:hypothetical protein M1271_05325 [Patescibacteria group bacterium]|nr:hypothetical protein [Patescibacteria group bacterium]